MPPTIVSAIGLFITSVINTGLMKYYTDIRKPGVSQWHYLVWSSFTSLVTVGLIVIVLRWPLKLRIPVGTKRWKVWALFAFSSFCLAVVIPSTTILLTMKGLPSAVAMVPMKSTTVVAALILDMIMKRYLSVHLRIAAFLALLSLSTVVFVPPPGGFDFLHSALAMTVVIAGSLFAYPGRVWAIRTFKVMVGEGSELNKAFIAIEQIGGLVWTSIFLGLTYLIPAGTVPQIDEIHWAVTHFDFRMGAITGEIYMLYAIFTMFLLVDDRNATIATVSTKLATVLGNTLATYILHDWYGARALYQSEKWAVALVVLASIVLAFDRGKKKVEEPPRPPGYWHTVIHDDGTSTVTYIPFKTVAGIKP